MIRQTIRHIGQGFTDLLYPPRCAVCDTLLPVWEKTFGNMESGRVRGICPDCRGKLRYLSEPCCLKCGKEIEDAESEFCADCGRLVRSYEKGFPVFNYVPPVSEAVLAMKYKNRQEYADFYGREIAERYGAVFHALTGKKAFIPVPIHKNRLKKRGYNQAELLAEAVSKYTGIPVWKDVLLRVEDTKPQKDLNDEERERNLYTAFAVQRGAEVPECALLTDDIYTTGSTVEACTRILKQNGVKQVYYTSVCIGKA